MDKKTVAIVGKGAREHALCWKLCQSPSVSNVYVIPGNGGTATISKAKNINIQIDVQVIADWCRNNKIDLVVVGPEQYLAEGLCDLLTANNLKCFGPTKRASQIETSKSWSKAFMEDVGIPTAKAKSFDNYQSAINYLETLPENETIVLKASGLAQGKGVFICKNVFEAKICAKEMMLSASLGSAGKTIVIEEFLEGNEVSVLAFCDGSNFSLMPPAQDNKRLKNNDCGPNTGGMGAVCPYHLSSDDLGFIRTEVFEKALYGMQSRGHPFKGVLYAGLMLTKDGIKVLEFNCRFGDPETQVLIPLLESDLCSVMEACCDEKLKSVDVKWKDECAVGIVMASGGYPTNPSPDAVIHGLPLDTTVFSDVQVFHAATELKESRYLAKSGRILTTVAVDKSMLVASSIAKKVCSILHFDGCQYRDDVANKAIARNILKKGTRTYKSAGVDINSGNELINKLKASVTRTHDKAVVTPLGSFAAAFDLQAKGFESPLLVTGCDGVGTKLKIAQECDNYSTIGQDLVAMSVNDILALGAQPLFFLDYIACSELNVNQAFQLIEGIIDGCEKSGCALIGGETAEMPGIFQKNEYELAGFVVGAVEKNRILPDKTIKAGDKIIRLPSSGIHSNGYSLVRKIMTDAGLSYHEKAPFSQQDLTYGEEFLKPTQIYCDLILKLHKASKIKAFAHITGGGLIENSIRILPKNLKIFLDAAQWQIPPVFGWLAAVGEVPEQEMLRTFNCGVGGIIVVSAENAENIAADIHSSIIGEIQFCSEGKPKFEISHLDTQLGKAMLPFIRSLVELKPLPPKRVAVLISGTGSNMEALIKETSDSSVAQIVLVISDKAKARGLNIAKNYNIQTQIVEKRSNESREMHEERIHSFLSAARIDIICLAGYMRILTESFVNFWRGKLLNIHPSLLPSFPGLLAQKQALEKGVKFSGCTVHFVEVEVDAGAIVEQGIVPIKSDDREEDLIERIKPVEHQIYPKALKLVASGKVKLDLQTGKLISS